MYDELEKVFSSFSSSLRFNPRGVSNISKVLNWRKKERLAITNKIGLWLAYKSLNEKWVNWWLSFTKVRSIQYGSNILNWKSGLEDSFKMIVLENFFFNIVIQAMYNKNFSTGCVKIAMFRVKTVFLKKFLFLKKKTLAKESSYS